MQLRVFHRTGYRYSAPISYAIQTLRLTPAPYDGLAVLRWQVSADGDDRALPSLVDGLGNILHCLTTDRPHREAVVTAEGIVETRRADGVVTGAPEPVPPLYFLRTTALTVADAAIVHLAHEAAAGGDLAARLHGLMRGVHESVVYRPGHTDTQTTAAAALERGLGVCQDHAHVFIAAARALGIPARYVSGYLWSGDDAAAHDASHAWAEAFVEGLGWVGFDAANGLCPDETYVRVAVGLDYRATAPVQGVRCGRANEEMQVKVQVQRAAPDQ
ncbi:MAG TPA: transglutaminase family protein [Stellaceae bacterium]|nr:transglutaminase family protein [Stellaceae bacterium]